MVESAAPEQVKDVESEIALFCPGCLYDLRGSMADACPECGAKLDRDLLAKSSIPWVHDKGVRAFIKTAWLATFKTQHFCLEVARPVSLIDARKFRRQVVGLLTLVGVLCGLFLALMLEDFREPLGQIWMDRPGLVLSAFVVSAVLLLLYFVGFTGLHMYWFHPKALSVEQQNRAVALSHYACAALLWLVPTFAGLSFSIAMGAFGEDPFDGALGWIAAIPAMVMPLMMLLILPAYLFVCARMAQHTSNRSGATRLLMWVLLPVLWLIWSGLILFVLPMIGFYVYLVVASL
ncbi:MAG: hypothetical protein AB8C95_15790 [Phycisphaeraceae bacterium]